MTAKRRRAFARGAWVLIIGFLILEYASVSRAQSPAPAAAGEIVSNPGRENESATLSQMQAARSTETLHSEGSANPETDFTAAVQTGDMGALTRLLHAEPQWVDETNQSGLTPLGLAVRLHRAEMIELLAANGAKWDVMSAVLAGRTNELPAMLRQSPAAVNTLVEGRGPVQVAAAGGDVNLLNQLIAANGDVRSRDNWGLSPLGYALINQRTGVAELLRQHGARENLFDVVYAGDSKMAAVLLAQDQSQVSGNNPAGFTALDIAAATGRTDILELLLKNGAAVATDDSVDERNPFGGRYPLHLAAYCNQTDAVKVLVRAGAEVNLTDGRGFTPLDWAVMHGAADTAAWLLKHKADASQATARFYFRPPMLDGLDQITGGETPLHLAVLSGQTNLIKLLLEAGVAVNAVDGHGLTPLDLANSQQPRLGAFSPGMMMQRGMEVLLEPLGIRPELGPSPSVSAERKTMAAQLILAAGGKYSGKIPEVRRWPVHP